MRTETEITTEIQALEALKPRVPRHRVLEIDTQIDYLRANHEDWETGATPAYRLAILKVTEWLRGGPPASQFWAARDNRNEAEYLFIRAEVGMEGVKLRYLRLLACSDAEAWERGNDLLGDADGESSSSVVKIGS